MRQDAGVNIMIVAALRAAGNMPSAAPRNGNPVIERSTIDEYASYNDEGDLGRLYRPWRAAERGSYEQTARARKLTQ